ncbi:hypothetical protein PP175_26240 (plasmid) [Aneurinibacillus sp. Ricciae_BoGa-3]|uniref:hypothetical protein n=1 Tax=Aneurinibacillus sp. Ricciae_BoGa-3 TaxID=3022697 RepID=UPI00233F98F1|nr:hypothetical protein [Aneurinibacillus sp. Ricciae_BoGa-3]WCK57568.1 hypothetical protein PP175_26240 [Aneurinibacillus sp. Ricciae_BoGa-3]
MEKLRRKLTDQYRETKMRTVWKCPVKMGTHNLTVAYFFEKPEVGELTQCIEDEPGNMYKRATPVKIDEIREDGMVFCSKM